MARAAKRAANDEVFDPTFYPVDDGMGEGFLHRIIGELLRPLIAAWLASRGVRAFTGANQFFYWQQHAPTETLAPDVYVVDDIDPRTRVDSWKVWERGGKVPSFALEVVSRDLLKDYHRAPVRYAALGVKELVIFDPEFRGAEDRSRFQVYRRRGKALELVRHTNGDRVRSHVLKAWLRSVGEGEETRLRLATGPRGDELFLTGDERADAERERADAERERADAERERAEAERERADAERVRREELEVEVARLRASLSRTGAGRKRS